MGEEKILVDSDVLVALYQPDDALHVAATALARHWNKMGGVYYATNLVKQESATVISKKMGMRDVEKFVKNFGRVVSVNVVVEAKLEEKSWELFLEQTKKGSSFIDCSNVVIFKEYKMDRIFSFDRFYKQMGLAMVE